MNPTDPTPSGAEQPTPGNRVRPKPKYDWACDNFKASEEDPTFCANCGDFASMHKGPTPGAPRSFCL